MINNAYIHIPFCKKICSYCDFCKNYYNSNIVKKYLKALDLEIDNNYKNEILDTLYIGGGTPSALSNEELSKLFNIIGKFSLSKDYEFTFECNYEDITKELLIFLKQNKVNRLSIGIQSFNDKYKDVLNRNINKKDMINSILLAKKYFNNINIDLMYALPSETLDDIKNDLDIIINLNINHISTYALIIEEHTNLYINKTIEIDDDTQNKMYYFIKKYLEEKGFCHYEFSNYAKPGYESKHNLNYWNNNSYYGFGAGASGFVDNIRYDNTKSIKKYIDNHGKAYEEKLSTDDLIKDEIMLNLRKIDGINKNEFYNKYNLNIEDVFSYKDLVNKNYLIENKSNIYINEEYLFISNEIIIMMLDSFKY